MTRLPSKQVLSVLPVGANRGVLLGAPGTAGAPGTLDPPLILDAWNNPIIFVGSDGLTGVGFESRKDDSTKEWRVTSTGLVPSSPGGNVSPAERSKSWRPFFASAGPDGDFHTGDDNVYSFEH
jgi:hypothetical protein